MPSLRTALVFPGCHPRGGVERVVWETMRHLSRRHDVTVVSSDIDTDGEDSVHVERVPRSGPPALAPLRWRLSAGRRLRSLNPGVVVSYGVECPVGDVLVVQSVHRAWLELGRPIRLGGVRVPRRLRYALPRHQVLLALEAAYFRAGWTRRIVPVSDNVARDLSRLYGVPQDRMVVIPNGYAADQCSPERCESLRHQMRASLGLAHDDVAVLLVANEWHRKGLGVLLEALEAFRDEPVHLVLVGRMAPDDFRPQMARLGLGQRVHYCGPTGDVGRFHAVADLFVMPTQYEAFGSVIVEALASGVPVITTALAGAAVAVRPGVNGLLQEDPDDVLELQGLLAQGLDPAIRSQWRLAAPGSVREYEWSRIMRRMEQVVTEVAA